ncbi:hypothetical protein M422DRAFT_250363 [Sphaerobolus stellatus SS14]|uniref:Uncharacterized protein n=1 Tax=Sphaerobolus stellatus (strain SS14) TaxID=990650 RepID=A0A0C9W3E5_SPHS4|nr:hypothetical protein M422DRAFT_250363 [Sphaerobolus stellatus SS14]
MQFSAFLLFLSLGGMAFAQGPIITTTPPTPCCDGIICPTPPLNPKFGIGPECCPGDVPQCS